MASTQGVHSGTLNSVPEEESEVPSLRGTKRSRGAEGGDDGDAAMADGAADVAGAGTGSLDGVHRAKRRALDANSAPAPASGASDPVPAPQPRSTTQTQGQGKGPASTGAKPTAKGPQTKSTASNNKLDTDENFLKAVNSTKRGKKHEDDFDREFNQLRITKPKKADTGAAAAAAAAAASGAATKGVPEAVVAPWDAIDDFGDVGIRGNFMVVVEMDIQRGSSAKSAPFARADNATRPEWTGRQNFKKFKTVSILYSSPIIPPFLLLTFERAQKPTAGIERRPTIELFPTDENDYGIGNGTVTHFPGPCGAYVSLFAAYWKAGASGSQSHSDVHDITVAHPPAAILYSKSKSKSKPPTKASRGGRARAPPAGGEDDEDDGVETFDLEADEMEIDGLPPPKPVSTRGKTGAKAKAAKAPAAAAATKKSPAKTKTTAAKGKGKAKAPPARTKKAPVTRGTTKRRNPALFLPSDSEDEEDQMDEIEDEDGDGDGDVMDHDQDLDASAAAVALALGADASGTATATGGTFGHASAAAVGDDASTAAAAAGMTPTLRSTAGTQLRREAVRASAAKRRAAAALAEADDDSDDDAAVFKGFGARKRGRVR